MQGKKARNCRERRGQRSLRVPLAKSYAVGYICNKENLQEAPAMEQNFTAFISYRHASPDQEVAKRLHTAIETYHIPGAIKKQTGRRQMGKCFRDQEELPLSADLGDDIERALDNSDWLIAVCTPRYLQSRWCLREMEYFIEHKGRERVLVVLADGRPAESFPEMLCWRIDENGNRVPYEPMAADIRGATDAERAKKLRTEKLRMLAPILGVGFDDLRRRARQRRIRITAIVCAAVIAAGAGLGAYIAANRAKQERLRLEAEEQQRLALEQARIAEEERLRAAENSIGELLERAAAETAADERQRAGRTLLEALQLSQDNEGRRHEEIIAALRRAMYIEPFGTVSAFTGQNVRLLNITPAPDGRLAVGIENSNSIALIDLQGDTVRYKVSVDNYQIMPPEFSPDGARFMAVCDMGRLLTVWNTADGSVAFTYTSKANERYHIAHAFFWGDADTLLVQDMDRFYLVRSDGSEKLFYTLGDCTEGYDYDYNFLTIITEKTLDELITLHVDDFGGVNVVCTPDWSRLLVSNRAGETGVVVLNGEGRVVTPIYGMPGTMAESWALSDDGKLAACLSGFGFQAVWDAETGDLLWIDALETGGGAAYSDPVFSPDGQTLTYVLGDTLYLCDALTGEVLTQGTMDDTNIVPTVSYSADGSYLFLRNQSLFIIDARGRLFGMKPAEFASAFNNAVELGGKVLFTRNDGTAYVCAMPAAASVKTVGPGETPELCAEYNLRWNPDSPITAVQGEHELTEAFKTSTALSDLTPQVWYSRDGQRAALSYADGVIEVFEASNGRVSQMLGQLTREITAVGMVGDLMVAADGGGRLMFYDLGKREVIQIVNLDSPGVDMAFNESGDLCMVQRYDDAIEIYDVAGAERLFTLRTAAYFTEFGFSKDGKYAVGVTDEGADCYELWTDETALIKYAKDFCGK